MNHPKVSVIIPTFNRVELLERAIQSVVSQTFQDYEIIVVQNGPTESSKSIADQFSQNGILIHYLYDPIQGGANARNKGVLAAKGDYVAFLDDDDEWLPQKLSEQVSFLEQSSDVSLVSCRALRIKEDGSVDVIPPDPASYLTYKTLILEGTVIPSLSSVMIRRECFDKVGLFNTAFLISDDHEFFLRIATRYGIFIMDKPLFRYNWHPNNISKNSLRMYTEKIAIIRQQKPFAEGGVTATDLRKAIRNYGNIFYSIASDYRDKQQYSQAFKSYLAAIYCDPFIGLQVSWSRFKNPVYRFLKPYFAVLSCTLKLLRFSNG